MTVQTPFASRITGTGSAFPKRRVTNQDLAQIVETNDEWIRERTGIRERRVVEKGNPEEFNSSLGARAAMQALEMAGKTPEDVDQIIVATCTPDTLSPSTACWVQKKIGAKRAWCVDMNAVCSGFVYALSTGDQFIRTGMAKTSLVIGSDVMTAINNWSDRTSCILFGDGAGAVVLERTAPTSPHRLMSHHMMSDGVQWDLFHVEAGGSNMEVTPEVHEKKLDKMQMKGKEIFKVAVKTLADYAVMAAEANGLKIEEIDWVVPHQANMRIMEAVAKRLGMTMDKWIVNIDRYGNTSAATVPTALDEAIRDGRIKPGHTVLLDVFGGGLTYGSTLLRF